MQHYFKKLPVFLYICIALFAYGCTYEKEFVNDKNHLKIKMEEQSFEDLLQLPAFNDAYRKVIKSTAVLSNDIMARTALEEQYGFDIVASAPVKVITDADNNTFYVMLIERPVVENLKFENLIIAIKDTAVGAVVMKYTLSKEVEYVQEHDSYKLDITDTEYTPLEVAGKKLWYFASTTCVTTATLMCHTPGDGYNNYHEATSFCIENGTSFSVVWGTVCTTVGGSGGGGGGSDTGSTDSNGSNDGSSSSGTHTSGGTSGSGSNVSLITILNSPTPPVCTDCPDVDEEELTPCEELKKLLKVNDTIINPNTPEADTLKFPNLKPKIQLIRNYVNSTSEYGYELEYKKVLNKFDSNFIEGGANGNFALSIPIGYYNYGGIHSHPKDSYSIPSFGDLVWIRDCYNDVTRKEYNKSKIVSIIVASNPNGGTPLTYALKIDNFTTFNQNINERLNAILLGNTTEKIIKINEQTGEVYKNSTNLEKTFFEMFQNCGFSLYKANDSLTNWNKLELIPGTPDGVVNSIPCNN